MYTSAEGSPTLDLDALESDPAETFVIKIGAHSLDFEILFCNEAFRKGGFRRSVMATNREAVLFRSWAQAVESFQPSHEWGHQVWNAGVAGRNRDWKVVRAAEVTSKEQREHDSHTNDGDALEKTQERKAVSNVIAGDSTEEMSRKISPPLHRLPGTNLSARWESIQTMMEMTDVGVFEYEPSGRLMHANDAWYRLSSHPRSVPAHSDFSFMDLVVPEDQAMVMSKWNTLVQGNPVTFEMRWKARPDTTDGPQWVLSACIPVFDEDGKLVSIAGNTIDINAQKKSQEVAVAKLKALELARSSERKFMRFAQLAPVAIYIFIPETGTPQTTGERLQGPPGFRGQYVNEKFFDLTGHPRVPFEQLELSRIVAEEDIKKVESGWAGMMEGKETQYMEFRLKKMWTDREGVSSNIWVQGSSYPELDENGAVISIIGTLFDISHFKWAEDVQRRRIEEALEAKRQQENFIDMTSHELRNPLSAVVQCADSVIATLQQLASITSEIENVNEEINMCIESVQTIVSCSLHQKRIIDDVLTLSKLDSNLILITPMRVQPAVVVSDALKMFEVECSQMDISLNFTQDESLKGFEWVMLDPSRLLQVLINLLTNAIKFTKDRPVRKLTVTLGGAFTRPPSVWHSVTFTSSQIPETNIVDKPEWGHGRKAYIWLKVEDTGCGITEEEQLRLFSRFSQATPRTHVKYGGSGLGLFISKSLATLQGGSIGVRSSPNVGSTFAFYVSTRLAQPPADAVAGLTIRPQPQRTLSVEERMKAEHLSILIVEDNLVNQKVLSKQLQKAGCNVSVAGNGMEALEWLKNSVFWRGERERDPKAEVTTDQSPQASSELQELDIILMDIEMPIMDGLTCARLIRDYEHQGLLSASQPQPTSSISPVSSGYEDTGKVSDSPIPVSPAHVRRRRLPILAVSANARSEQVEQALAAGMDDAISKPFRIPELWPKMEALVRRRPTE